MIKTANEQYRDDLIQIADRLTAEQLREVRNYAMFLAERGGPRQEAPSNRHVTTEGWAGALSDLKAQYKSGVDLQHDIVKQWGDRD